MNVAGSSKVTTLNPVTKPCPPPQPPPPPPPPGYTDAASVNLSRMPVAPQSSTVINVSAPITISGSVTDVIYNVTAAIADAIVLTSTARLERVRINANNLAQNGVRGPGTVKDVSVYDAVSAGFHGVKRFEGATYSQNASRDFWLVGTGVSSAPDALMKSYSADWIGMYIGALYNSRFEGALAALNAGGIGSATGIEFWGEGRGNYFNIMISNANPGYGLAIYRGSSLNTIHEFYGDGAGAPDSDPGISIGGGSYSNVIDKATVKNYALGLIIGEDVAGVSHHNTVHTLRVERAPYGCVFMDRGSYSNIVGDVGGSTCFNTGGPDSSHLGSVYISNRPSQTGITPPHDNRVLALAQSGTQIVPQYAVYLGPGTTGNTVNGSASSWRIAKLLNEGLTVQLSSVQLK
jgi:hypothetical protein